ncbi:MAG: extracellular solute-binding protein [Clostridiales bacterium]|nr:extracellular solute-binding protein [Clostridiales bacterium]
MHGKTVAALALVLALLTTLPEARAAAAPPEEKRLVVYTAHKEDVYTPILREFEERTGIWVSVVAGGTAEMLERISFEAEAPVCDVMFGGGVESLAAYSRYYAPPPEELARQVDPRYLREGSDWLPFSALPIVMIYNTRLTGNRAPQGWLSLFEDRFAGRIAFADPSVSGSSFTALFTLLTVLPEADTLGRFVRALKRRVLGGSGDVVTAVANGSCTVGVTLEETALKAIAASMDIAMVYPEEGTSAVPDGAAIIRGCPHPENAAAFLRFILSRDVQTRLCAQMYRRPVLAGIPVDPGSFEPFILIAYDIGLAGERKAGLLADWSDALARSKEEGLP